MTLVLSCQLAFVCVIRLLVCVDHVMSKLVFLLNRVARFGILSRDLGNIQGCWDFSREFLSGKKPRENSRDF